MIAADRPVQRPPDAKLLVVDGSGRMTHAPRSAFVDLLRPGDVVIANDAATLPASLHGVHRRTGAAIEVRLAWRSSLSPQDVNDFAAVVFGAGDFHTRTEDRPLPPALRTGDRLELWAHDDHTALAAWVSAPSVVSGSSRLSMELNAALGSSKGPTAPVSQRWPTGDLPPAFSRARHPPLWATVEAVLDHPRLVSLRFDGSPDAIWAGLAQHGRPVQYAHMPSALALWDVWAPVAAVPVAYEPPSAGFVLDWRSVRTMRDRGIAFATITHAAGLSSTGDRDLDGRLPFAEPYRIPAATALAIRKARASGGRVVAVGTTVVRALEHAAARDGNVRAIEGVATGRIGAASRLRVVDVLLSGTHEQGSSHYEMLRAFAAEGTLASAGLALEAGGYRTHEFGDSVWLEKTVRADVANCKIGVEMEHGAKSLVCCGLQANGQFDGTKTEQPVESRASIDLLLLTAN